MHHYLLQPAQINIIKAQSLNKSAYLLVCWETADNRRVEKRKIRSAIEIWKKNFPEVVNIWVPVNRVRGNQVLLPAGLTDAAADRQAVLLWLKVIPVASTATVDKLSTATILAVKVPAGQQGPAWTSLCIGPAHILEDNIHRLTVVTQ